MARARIKTATFGLSFLWGIILFCGFALIAWILFHFAAPESTYEEKRASVRLEKLTAIRKDAQDKLYSPAKWLDKSKGTVQLPIDTAMLLVVNDYQTREVKPSSVKVEHPYPAGLQPPPGANPAVAPVKGIGNNPSASPAPASGPNVNAPEVRSLPSPTPGSNSASVPNPTPVASPAPVVRPTAPGSPAAGATASPAPASTATPAPMQPAPTPSAAPPSSATPSLSPAAASAPSPATPTSTGAVPLTSGSVASSPAPQPNPVAPMSSPEVKP